MNRLFLEQQPTNGGGAKEVSAETRRSSSTRGSGCVDGAVAQEEEWRCDGRASCLKTRERGEGREEGEIREGREVIQKRETEPAGGSAPGYGARNRLP